MSEAFNDLCDEQLKILAKLHNITDYEVKSREQLLLIINEFFGGLELEQFKVLAKYYGLENYESKTLEELKNAVIVSEVLSRINDDINNVPRLNITRDLSNNNFYLEFVKN